MTRKRFEYLKMTAEEFRDDLDAIDMPVNSFARISGSLAERVNKWAFGHEDIPMWVPPFLAAMGAAPEALIAARREAAARIIMDNQFPDRGQFPYLKRAEFDDDE